MEDDDTFPGIFKKNFFLTLKGGYGFMNLC